LFRPSNLLLYFIFCNKKCWNLKLQM
jgi:hypothetical protein